MHASTGRVKEGRSLFALFYSVSKQVVTPQPGILAWIEGYSCFTKVSLSLVLSNTDDAGTLLSLFCCLDLLCGHVGHNTLSVACC